LIVKDGATTGKTAIVTKRFPHFPCAVNEHVFRLSVNHTIADPRYVFYYLYSPKGNREILNDFRGATVGGISHKFANKVFIPLPPLAGQEHIAGQLAKVDRLRRIRRYTRQLGETFLQAVVLEMFGDPVRNPKKWEFVKLGEKITFITSGSRGWAKYYSDKGPLFLRVQNLGANNLLLDEVAFVQPPNSAESRRTKVQSGDLLISATADIGRTGVIPEGFPEAYVNQHLFLLRLEKINPIFVAGYFSTTSGKAQILRLNREGVKSGLNFDDVKGLTIFYPPLGEQERFAQIVKQYEHFRFQQCEAERQVERLFQTLLDKLFKVEQ